MAKKINPIVPIGIAVGVGALALLFATGASAAEEPFDPNEEDDDPEIDPNAAEEIPEETEEIKEETGVDIGEGGEGWTDEKVNEFLGSLGYRGSRGARVRQFQRDSRVNPLLTDLRNMNQVATSLADGVSIVDGKVGPKTIEQLNRAGLIAVTLNWNPAKYVGKGGEPAFFEGLQEMGYNVTKRPEQATKQFQRDVRTALDIPVRTDGNVDPVTLNAFAIALTQHAMGDWIVG